jgi:hypothetical protein
MSIQKILGFALVLGGIGIILYSLYASFTFFTGSATPPEIFSLGESGSGAGGQEGGDAISQLLEEQLKGLLPAGFVPQMLNLTVWSIFAGLLMLGGGQIAGLGIKLLKS